MRYQDNRTETAILSLLEGLRIRWESRDDFDRRYAGEWPIVRRGEAEAYRVTGGWLVLPKDSTPLGFGETNSAARGSI